MADDVNTGARVSASHGLLFMPIEEAEVLSQSTRICSATSFHQSTAALLRMTWIRRTQHRTPSRCFSSEEGNH